MFKRLSRTLKIWIVLLEITLVVFVFLLAYNFLLPIGKEGRLVYFDDYNTSKVLQRLQENGYNMTDWDHLLLPKHAPPKAGWYRIGHTDAGRYHFFQTLYAYPLPDMQIKIYAGDTRHEILQRLANDLKLDLKTLTTEYDKHKQYEEGDILAGRYTIAREADECVAMHHLFARSKMRFEMFRRKHFIDPLEHNTMNVLLTIASVIQKESNDPEEMPLISSVIYNRLKRGMKLQMDGTLNYGKYSHQIVTPERIKHDNTFYNTYKYKGLPPAPLSSVSIDALQAAMFPARSDYLFFMLSPNGKHRFCTTYREHLANLRDFRAYQKKHLRERNGTKSSNDPTTSK